MMLSRFRQVAAALSNTPRRLRSFPTKHLPSNTRSSDPLQGAVDRIHGDLVDMAASHREYLVLMGGAFRELVADKSALSERVVALEQELSDADAHFREAAESLRLECDRLEAERNAELERAESARKASAVLNDQVEALVRKNTELSRRGVKPPHQSLARSVSDLAPAAALRASSETQEPKASRAVSVAKRRKPAPLPVRAMSSKRSA